MTTDSSTRIIRPDLRKPNEFQIIVGKEVLEWVEEGLLDKATRLHHDMASHDRCDMRREDGCKVREDWMLSSYGSLEAAEDGGFYKTDCSEHLAYVHRALAALMDFINQARYLRARPDARSYYDLSEAQAKLLAIQGEMNHRMQQGNLQTGQMAKLTPEKLAELDAEHKPQSPADNTMPSDGKKDTLLGLDPTTTTAERKIKVVK